jgi:hypothetical protein
MRHEGFHGFKNRLGFQQHPFSAAKRTVVYRVVAIVRECAQIVDGHVDKAGFSGATDDAVIERPAEEIRKDRDDVELHGPSV